MSAKEPNLQESNVRQVQATLVERMEQIKSGLPENPYTDDRSMFALGQIQGLQFACDMIDDMWHAVELLHMNRRVGA